MTDDSRSSGGDERRGPSSTSSDNVQHRLWGGAFGAATASDMDALNRSIGIDFRLWPHDVRLSIAWATALGDARIISPDDSARLVAGLAKVEKRLAAGVEPLPSDEDIHTLIDRLLH